MRDSLQTMLSSVLCLTLLGACATMKAQTSEQLYMRHRAVLKLAVQIGVVEFLHRHATLAQPVAVLAGACRETLVGQIGDTTLLTTAIQHEMGPGQLSPTEQLLVLNLIETVAQGIRTYFVEQDVVPTTVLLRVSEICGWIADAAVMQGAR